MNLWEPGFDKLIGYGELSKFVCATPLSINDNFQCLGRQSKRVACLCFIFHRREEVLNLCYVNIIKIVVSRLKKFLCFIFLLEPNYILLKIPFQIALLSDYFYPARIRLLQEITKDRAEHAVFELKSREGDVFRINFQIAHAIIDKTGLVNES